MSLQDKLDAFKVSFEADPAPAAAIEAFHRSIREQIASGQAARAVKAGDTAPSFALADTDGNIVSSADLLAKGPLMVSFYRGNWCPYCNLELQALQEAADDIRAMGASLYIISQQTIPNSRKSQRDHNLSFPVLSDVGGEIADAFGLRYTVPDYLKQVFLSFGLDLAVVNGDPNWTLPMPARYVIGQDGVVVYAEINPDYTRRPDPSELMPILAQLQQGRAA